MTTHTLSPELLQAYRTTCYSAWSGTETLALRIGIHSPALAEWMQRLDVQGGCFVTAWNPFGQSLDAQTNAVANAGLEQELRRCGWQVFPGEGRGLDPAWPAEASFLVLGPDYCECAALCVGYNQHAVVTFGGDAIPRLLVGQRVANRDSNFRDARMLVPKLAEQSVVGTWSIVWPNRAAPVTASTRTSLVAAMTRELRKRNEVDSG